MRISDWSSDVCSSDLPLFLSVWLRNGLSDRIPRRPDRRLAEKPDSPLLCFGVPGKVERRVRMPLGRNQGGGAGRRPAPGDIRPRSEEHTSELQSLMRKSNAVFCLKKNKKCKFNNTTT